MQREGILLNEVMFSCLLNLCSHHDLVDKGQELFDSMESLYGLKPDVETFTYSVIGSIYKGKKVHDEISRQGLLEHHIVLGGALVDMYVKCGALC